MTRWLAYTPIAWYYQGMSAQLPSKIMLEAAERAAKMDPTITPTRVKGWIDKRRYIHRPPVPLDDGYISCLIDLSELTGTAGYGKGVGVVTSLAYRGHLDYISVHRLR